MMDDNTTKEKNEILRKIKFYKQKQISLPNFIRKAKMEIVANRETKDPNIQREEYLKYKSEQRTKAHEKEPTIKTAETNSMNTSRGGGAFGHQKKSLKKTKDKGSEVESKNTVINDASERGDDTTSIASRRTGSKNTINIQVPLSNQASNTGISSAIKRINSNNAPA